MATRGWKSWSATCATASSCWADPTSRRPRSSQLAQIPNPDHATPVDLDGDGVKDLLVADLGAFLPGDHDQGQVVWLRGLETGGFSTYAMGGFPRVADVEAADFDGDGKPDLLVAGFGWRRTGGITLLRTRP